MKLRNKTEISKQKRRILRTGKVYNINNNIQFNVSQNEGQGSVF